MKAKEKKIRLVERRFNYWRRTRKHRDKIPKALWEAAKDLYPENSIGKICNRLKLSYSTFKDYVASDKGRGLKGIQKDRGFIEVPLTRSALPGSKSEEISFINPRGIKLSLQNIKGNENLLKECLQLYFMEVR